MHAHLLRVHSTFDFITNQAGDGGPARDDGGPSDGGGSEPGGEDGSSSDGGGMASPGTRADEDEDAAALRGLERRLCGAG